MPNCDDYNISFKTKQKKNAFFHLVNRNRPPAVDRPRLSVERVGTLLFVRIQQWIHRTIYNWKPFRHKHSGMQKCQPEPTMFVAIHVGIHAIECDSSAAAGPIIIKLVSGQCTLPPTEMRTFLPTCFHIFLKTLITWSYISIRRRRQLERRIISRIAEQYSGQTMTAGVSPWIIEYCSCLLLAVGPDSE